MRIVKVAAGEDAAAWSRALGQLDASRARVLKAGRGRGVLGTELVGRRVVLKFWDTDLYLRLKGRLNAGRAARHWRGAAWLEQQGLRTARCLAIARTVIAPGEGRRAIHREWLVMEELRGMSLLDHLTGGSLSVRQEHDLARAVGRLIALIERAGRYNRDSKPSNLIVLEPWNGEPAIAMVDCVAIRRQRPLGIGRRDVGSMLASVVVETIPLGCRPRRTLLLRGLLALHIGSDGKMPPGLWRSPSVKSSIARRWLAGQQAIERWAKVYDDGGRREQERPSR